MAYRIDDCWETSPGRACAKAGIDFFVSQLPGGPVPGSNMPLCLHFDLSSLFSPGAASLCHTCLKDSLWCSVSYAASDVTHEHVQPSYIAILPATFNLYSCPQQLSTVCLNVDPLRYALHNMPLLTKTDHDQMAKATKHTRRRAWQPRLCQPSTAETTTSRLTRYLSSVDRQR